MIDFPNCISTVIFTPGCNFSCGYCHNPDLVDMGDHENENHMSEEEVLKYLEEKKDWIDGVVISGGEPTIHRDLPEFIAKIKEKGMKVKLDTNGTNPEMLKRLIDDKMLDYVAVDIKNHPEKYHIVTGVDAKIKNIKKTIEILKNSEVEHEFRTTIVPGQVDHEDVQKIGEFLSGSKNYVIQNFCNKNPTYDEELRENEPFDKKDLEEMREKVLKHFSNVEIRG